MIASTCCQTCINIDVVIIVASRRKNCHHSFFSHQSRFRFSASSSSFSLNSSASSSLLSSSVFLREINLKQIIETSTTFVIQQRIKDVHQANMKRELKQKLWRLKAQSAALNQSKNNSVIKNTISQTSDTIFSSDSCIQTMIFRYLFIDIIQLILIFKNEFWVVNIFKLINDHISNSLNKQDLRLSWFDKLQAHDDDVIQQNLKSMILFIRCLEVYNQCLIETINDQYRHSLQASLAWYIDYLLKLHLHYIFKSLRIFHFYFHEIHIIKEVNDSNEWYNAEDELINQALIKKTSAIASQMRYQSQRVRKQFYDSRLEEESTLFSICNKFNVNSCIYSDCTYQHICSECNETHAAINCKTLNSNSQSIERKWHRISISLISISKFFSYQLMKIDEVSLAHRDSLNASAW